MGESVVRIPPSHAPSCDGMGDADWRFNTKSLSHYKFPPAAIHAHYCSGNSFKVACKSPRVPHGFDAKLTLDGF